jgi:hypothetical protein
MIDTTKIDLWLAAYEQAWRTDDPADIAALFEPDVRYRTAPWREPYVGIEAIVDWWIGQENSTIAWTFEYHIVASEGGLYVVRGITRYPEGFEPGDSAQDFENIWLVTLADSGRAKDFVEYWMLRK